MGAQPIQPDATPDAASATQEAREDAEDLAAVQDWQARGAAGTTSYTSAAEARRHLGLDRQGHRPS